MVTREIGIGTRRGALVSFSGRGFDILVLELAALRYGIRIPGALACRNIGSGRNRAAFWRKIRFLNLVLARADKGGGLVLSLREDGRSHFVGSGALVAQSLERPLTRGILARTWISEPGESHRDKRAEPQSPQASAAICGGQVAHPVRARAAHRPFHTALPRNVDRS